VLGKLSSAPLGIILAKNSFKTARSYIDKEKFYEDVKSGIISYPVFLKPVKGSASININKVISKEELEILFSRYDDLMIQEFLDGDEYGADVYIDLISGEPVSIFTKKKRELPLPYGRGFLLHSGPNGPAPQA